MLTKWQAMIRGNKEASTIPGTGISVKPACWHISNQSVMGWSHGSVSNTAMSESEKVMDCFKMSTVFSTFSEDNE